MLNYVSLENQEWNRRSRSPNGSKYQPKHLMKTDSNFSDVDINQFPRKKTYRRIRPSNPFTERETIDIRNPYLQGSKNVKSPINYRPTRFLSRRSYNRSKKLDYEYFPHKLNHKKQKNTICFENSITKCDGLKPPISSNKKYTDKYKSIIIQEKEISQPLTLLDSEALYY